MNKTLQEEEFDRELALKHSQFYGSSHKVKIGKKVLCFEGSEWYGRKLKFEKGVSHGQSGESLTITCEWEEKKTQRCSMGHDHVVEKKERHWDYADIQWEYVEQLIEWLQSGSWSQIQRKEPVDFKLLREARATLAEISTVSTAFGPACMKVIRKINERLGDK